MPIIVWMEIRDPGAAAILREIRNYGIPTIFMHGVGSPSLPQPAPKSACCLLTGELSQPEADIAFKIEAIFRNYDRACGQRRSPASPSLEVGSGRAPGSFESEYEAEKAIIARRRYDELQHAMAMLSAPVRALVVARLTTPEHIRLTTEALRAL